MFGGITHQLYHIHVTLVCIRHTPVLIFIFLRLKLHFYEYGDKTGLLLAWKFRQQTEHTITEIGSSTGTIVDTKETNEAFRNYYKKNSIVQSAHYIWIHRQTQCLDSPNTTDFN